jgi:KDO2-lipid IV(A) lauroyltransferase
MPAKSHQDRLAYRLGYTSTAFSALVRIAGGVGRPAARIIGDLTGRAYAATQPGVVDVVRKNLGLLEGRPVSSSEAAGLFSRYGQILADYLWLGSRTPVDGLRLAEIGEGVEHMKSALSKGNGIILATGHFGFFEFGALVLGQMGFPVSAVTYPEPTPALTEWRAEYRRRWGAETIRLASDAFSSLRALEALEKGRFIAMLVDRPTGDRTIDVDLPGGRIAFSMAPSILSWMSGCAVLPVDVRLTPTGKYVIRAHPPVACDRTLPRNDAIESSARQIAGALIEGFRADPLQWFHFVPLTTSKP